MPLPVVRRRMESSPIRPEPTPDIGDETSAPSSPVNVKRPTTPVESLCAAVLSILESSQVTR